LTKSLRALNRFNVVALVFVALLGLIAPHSVSAEELASPNVSEDLLEKAKVDNFAKVSSTMWRGAQPSDKALKKLAQGGIKTVIDLRMDGDGIEHECQTVNLLGLHYVHIPMGFMKPTPDKILSFLKIVTAPENQPVFVHCRQGADRTGTLCAIYRRLVQNWTFEECWVEMRTHHFKPFLASLKRTVQEFQCDEWRKLLAAPENKMATQTTVTAALLSKT
jgi:protein tyrosine/serine phosphatase